MSIEGTTNRYREGNKYRLYYGGSVVDKTLQREKTVIYDTKLLEFIFSKRTWNKGFFDRAVLDTDLFVERMNKIDRLRERVVETKEYERESITGEQFLGLPEDIFEKDLFDRLMFLSQIPNNINRDHIFRNLREKTFAEAFLKILHKIK